MQGACIKGLPSTKTDDGSTELSEPRQKALYEWSRNDTWRRLVCVSLFFASNPFSYHGRLLNLSNW